MCVCQAGTEGGCVVLFEVTSDGIVYSRSFTNLGGKHSILQHWVLMKLIF